MPNGLGRPLTASLPPLKWLACGMDSTPDFPIPQLTSLDFPEQGKWSLTERAQALAIYAECGSYSLTSHRTGIPLGTIRYWAESEAGNAFIQDIRQAVKARFGWLIVEGIGESLAVLRQALRHGDEVVLRDGSIVNKRQSAIDAAKIASILMDKHAMLTGSMDSSKHVDQALTKLATQLLERTKQSEPTPPLPSADPNAFMG